MEEKTLGKENKYTYAIGTFFSLALKDNPRLILTLILLLHKSKK
jgi:hypothetical protein